MIVPVPQAPEMDLVNEDIPKPLSILYFVALIFFGASFIFGILHVIGVL